MPSNQELIVGTNQLNNGVSPYDFASKLAVSPEFLRAHPNVKSFVDGLYLDVLGRTPDPAGEQFWIGQLQGRQLGPLQVAKKFVTSPGSYLVNGTIASDILTSMQGYDLRYSVTPPWNSVISGATDTVNGYTGTLTSNTAIITMNVSGNGRYRLNLTVKNTGNQPIRSFTLIANGGTFQVNGTQFLTIRGFTANYGQNFWAYVDFNAQARQVSVNLTWSSNA